MIKGDFHSYYLQQLNLLGRSLYYMQVKLPEIETGKLFLLSSNWMHALCMYGELLYRELESWGIMNVLVILAYLSV